jgi:hypothetical protein
MQLKFQSDLEAPDLVGSPAENTPEIVFRNQVGALLSTASGFLLANPSPSPKISS